jgi:biotin carboxylase
MKRILILGAGEYQVPLIESAKKMGLFTIVVSPTGGYPGLNITDKAYFFDVRDKNKILEIAKKEVIDGVTTDQTDIAVSTVAYIAEKLNLAGIGFQVSKLFTDKYLMREKCKSAGIPTLKYTLVDTVREAENFCSVAGYPVVLKPVDNQGSRGVYKIHDNNELEKYFDDSRHFSSNKKVLMV